MTASSRIMCAAEAFSGTVTRARSARSVPGIGSNRARNVYVRFSRIGNQRCKESR